MREEEMKMKISAYKEKEIKELVGNEEAQGMTVHQLNFVQNLEMSSFGYAFQLTQVVGDVEEGQDMNELKAQLDEANLYSELPNAVLQAKQFVSVIEAKNETALHAIQLMHDTMEHSLPNAYDPFVSHRINKEAEVNRITHCYFAIPITEANMDELNNYHGLSDCAKQHVRKRRLMMFDN